MLTQEQRGIDAGIFLLSEGAHISKVKNKLNRILKQSQKFSEIHIISTEECFAGEAFCEYNGDVLVHVLNDSDVFSDEFYEILSESKCDLIIFTNGEIENDNKYSLERAYLKAILCGSNLVKNDDSFFISQQNDLENLFGRLDDFVFSRPALLEKCLTLSGLSESAQTLFLAESIAALGDQNALAEIVKKPSFSLCAEKWAISLTNETFFDAVNLCKGLFEASDHMKVSDLALAAEMLTLNILKVAGKFVSPFVKRDEEKIRILLGTLLETLKGRNNISDSCELKAKLEQLLYCPAVSVIVPVYNCAKEIRRCIDSLFLQSYKSIEIICVNDGSEDNSLEILKDIELKSDNLRVLTQENSGQAAARNRAISVARGQYLGFVDGDDWVEADMFEKMTLALEFHPEAQLAKCGMICDYTYPVSESERRSLEDYFSEPEPEGLHRVGPDRLLTGVVWDKLYRASLIKDNGIKFPEGVKNEDEAFALFCVCYAEQYVLLKNKFYHYIRTPRGTMNTQVSKAAEGKIPDVFSICNLMLDFLVREKKYSYIGRVIKAFLGAADRFEASPLAEEINHAVFTLLEKSDFLLYMDTIVPDKREWCRKKAGRYISLGYQKPYEFPDLSMWLPTESTFVEHHSSAEPKITFIVPVYNVEQFLIPTIESLRSQTVEDIEILCINDGSKDGSVEILEQYQEDDGRIRVISQENAGVSAARNRGIAEARGEYIAFVDGDDLLSYNMAEKCLEAAYKYSLEVVAFDYRCFDCITGKSFDHYWTITNRHSELPMDQVFGAEAFKTRTFSFYGSSCVFMWKTSFLRENNIYFPRIKISEDMCFVVYAFSNVKRAMIIPEAFYYYRRNVPGSAITSLKKASSADPRKDTVTEMCKTIEALEGKNLPAEARANIIGRLLGEMRFFCEASEHLNETVENAIGSISEILIPITHFLSDSGLRVWVEKILRKLDSEKSGNEVVGKAEIKIPQLAVPASFLWTAIEKKRKKTKHDLILVIAFLGSKTADPLDSWTFFSWLQEHNIPSRYVISSNSNFYHALVKDKKDKNVIALSKSCLQDDHAAYFLRKLFVPLTRAKAVVFEDFVWPWSLRARFKKMDWKLVFLQHGVTYFKLSRKMHEFFTRFNLVNVSSLKEKELLEREIGSFELDSAPYPNYVVAGFPRWDKLASAPTSVPAQKVVFIMFTWRDVFEKPNYNIRESIYFNSITSLIKSSMLDELRDRGIKFVFAPHHHLFDIAPEILNEWPIEFCEQKDISYWVQNASCLITDFSSITWDFRFQDKPVIHWLMDQWDVNLGEDLLSQLAFANKKISEVSRPVRNINELYERLTYYADKGFIPTEEEIENVKPFFPYRDGFSQRVYEKLCCDNMEKGAED